MNKPRSSAGFLATLFALFLASVSAVACDCRFEKNVSPYMKAADIVFKGKVTFTNDDGSGTFTQGTLVHFEVEEAFKGIDASTRDIWVDPGSYTSCYADYVLGERYLVFAYKTSRMPASSESMTVTNRAGKKKPLPPGIDPAHPPAIYLAPECSGTLLVGPDTQELVDGWTRTLRASKKREER